MFQDACKAAGAQILPIIVVSKLSSGKIATSVGAGLLLNEDGWVLTAKHIIAGVSKVLEAASVSEQRKAIRANPQLNAKQKQDQLKALPKTNVEHAAVVWGQETAEVSNGEAIIHPNADVCVFKVDGFKVPARYRRPKFRDDVLPGEMLVRIGYALVEDKLTVGWDDDQQNFKANGLPPLFINEGVVSRFINLGVVQIIEMSSPGLNGQSGGPLVDPSGHVCGVQVSTTHYPLGFANKTKTTEFYHVGNAVHSSTVLRFLDENNVSHATHRPRNLKAVLRALLSKGG